MSYLTLILIEIPITMIEDNEKFTSYEEDSRIGCNAMIILIMIAIFVVVAYVAFQELESSSSSNGTPSSASTPQPLPISSHVSEDRLITLTPEQWTEHLNALNDHRDALNSQRQIVSQLQMQLNSLSHEVQQLQQQIYVLSNKPITSPNPKPSVSSKKPSEPTKTSMGFRPDALIFAGYKHNLMSPTAQFSVRNTTNKIITAFKVRIQYYNMKGRMLDYQELSYELKLKPNEAYTIKLDGYEWQNNYVHHTSVNAHEGYPYKVSFSLLSYTEHNK